MVDDNEQLIKQNGDCMQLQQRELQKNPHQVKQMEQQIRQDLKQIQRDQWNVQQMSHQMQTHPQCEMSGK